MLLFLFLWVLVDKATGQGSTFPATATSGPVQDCDSCFFVARVDEAILGDKASYYTRLGNFTVSPSDITGGLSLAALPTASVVTYNSTLVTNPTVYNVFTALQSFTQTLDADGSCVTVGGTVTTLELPLSVQIPTDPSSGIITQAEESFVSYIGGGPCIVGGVIVTTVVSFPSISSSAYSVTISEQSSAIPTASNQSNSASHTIFTTSMSSNIAHTTSTSNSTSTGSTVSSDSSGLSQSAKLGIGIGIGVPGAVILVLIGALLWKRKSAKMHAKGRTDPLSELPSKEPDSLAELENKIPPQELENNIAPQELSVERRPELQ